MEFGTLLIRNSIGRRVYFSLKILFKFFRLLQPSIIYIDDAEKTFLKKVPKTDKTDPKRLKKDLSKIVKSIGPTDLVGLPSLLHFYANRCVYLLFSN